MILTHGANSLPRGGGGMTVNIGGREYPVVQIGEQLWIAENIEFDFEGLSYGKNWSNTVPYTMRNGSLPSSSGWFYNFAAARYIEVNKGDLLPPGWRIPTRNDCWRLFNEVGYDAKKLKTIDGWSNNNGNDALGFHAYPWDCFYVYSQEDWNPPTNQVGRQAVYWTSESDSSAVQYDMYISDAGTLDIGSKNNRSFEPIRLVKDA